MILTAPQRLFTLAALLTIGGVAVLTAVDPDVSVADFISRLNELQQPKKSLGSGLFLLIGIFWIGTIDTLRRSLEPKKLDPWLRYSVLAFAASYLLSLLFPCDAGCPPPTSVNQWLHSTLVWGLSFGPVVFALRLIKTSAFRRLNLACWALLALAIAAFVDALSWQWLPGLWQRLYELSFCVLFALWLSQLNKFSSSD